MHQNKVYVGNLSYTLDEASLRAHFEKFGEITDIALPKDRVTGRPRGFAFITFADTQAASSSLELNGQDLAGRKAVVNFAREREQGGSERGGRGDRGDRGR